MSGAWYTFTAIGSATSSAIFGAALYLFADVTVMETRIGVESRRVVTEAVHSAKELPNDISAAGNEVKYVLQKVAAQVSLEAEVLRRHFESPRTGEKGR